NLLLRKPAQDLTEVTHLQATSRGSVGLAAAFPLKAVGFGFVELPPSGGHVLPDLARPQQRVAKLREIFLPADTVADVSGGSERRSVNQLDVLHVLGGGAGGNLVEPLAEMVLRDSAEAREGVEEMIVGADALGRHERAHGEGVDQVVIEMLVLEDLGG